MYRVIVVDDEPLIREGVSGYINDTSADFHVEAQLKDGQRALDYLRQNPVDVVITDIRMPNMTGVELAGRLYEEFPEIVVVIISGYREFEYARQAMQYQVQYYLLKPVNLSEIDETLAKIGQTLREREHSRKQQEQLYEINSLYMQEFLFDCFTGARSADADVLRRLGLAERPESAVCAVVEADYKNCLGYIRDRWEYGRDNFCNVILNLLRGELRFYKVSEQDAVLLMVAVGEESAEFAGLLERSMEQARSTFYEMSGLPLKLTVVKQMDSLLAALDKREGVSDMRPMELFKNLLSHINAGDLEGASKLIERFFAALEGVPIEYAHGLILNIVTRLLKSGRYERLRDRYSAETVLTAEGLPELERICRSLFNELNCTPEEDDKADVIRQAKRFMDEHYSQDISLADVADAVFLSPAYFSRFFREHTGESFTDYLIRVRMEHAIELLRQRKKITDIAQAVGYSSARYFTRAFKQYTGDTPKDYRITGADGYAD